MLSPDTAPGISAGLLGPRYLERCCMLCLGFSNHLQCPCDVKYNDSDHARASACLLSEMP